MDVVISLNPIFQVFELGLGSKQRYLPHSCRPNGINEEKTIAVVTLFSNMVFLTIPHLVGGFNPFEKYYSSQIGSFPQVGVKI